MGRAYAGILGQIGFLTILVQGLINRHASDELVINAIIALVCFMVIGFLVGVIAEWVVEDSIRTKLIRLKADQEALKAELESQASGS